ncbi:glycosyltransferase family 4 protein [Halorientalis pallida]|uniref:glycosyltransferase family 4 protein n=1 Tax=Halorientalis pallida TaxID=2479928 RepID=UPI003C6F0512
MTRALSQQDDTDPTVFLFSTHDLSTVQGTTEAHYVAKFFADRGPTHLFAPLSSGVGDAETHRVGSGGFWTLLLMNVFLVPWILVLARKHRPTVVYAYRNVIVPPLLLGVLTDATVLYDLRVDPYEQPKEFNPDTLFYDVFAVLAREAHTIALHRADVVFALSEPLKRNLVANFDLPEEKIRLVPLGVDTTAFAPVDTQSERFHLCYLGSMREHRGLETVVDALNALPEAVQEQLVFELYGSIDDAYRAELEARADGSYELVWQGYVPHEEVPAAVGRCDCAVSPLPPLDGFEVSSPAKIYEYLALGLPVVATDITAHRNILADGDDALLVDPEDPTAMADAIERLATDDAFRERLATAARQHALDHSWETRFRTIVDAIDDEAVARRESHHGTE